MHPYLNRKQKASGFIHSGKGRTEGIPVSVFLYLYSCICTPLQININSKTRRADRKQNSLKQMKSFKAYLHGIDLTRTSLA